MMQTHLEMGETLKDRGLDAVEESAGVWLEQMRGIARDISRETGRVSCDDLRRWADRFQSQPYSPNAWGAVFRGRGWVCVGRTKSTYSSNHAREIRVWRWGG